MWQLQLIIDNFSECHFVDGQSMNITLLAILVTTLVMYVLYHLSHCGAVVLLAGMRSILKSHPLLAPLASKVPKDPQTILTLYHLDPITHIYICCLACHCLYPYSIVKTKKRKVPSSIPVNCTYCCVCSGATCSELLFDQA